MRWLDTATATDMTFMQGFCTCKSAVKLFSAHVRLETSLLLGRPSIGFRVMLGFIGVKGLPYPNPGRLTPCQTAIEIKSSLLLSPRTAVPTQALVSNNAAGSQGLTLCVSQPGVQLLLQAQPQPPKPLLLRRVGEPYHQAPTPHRRAPNFTEVAIIFNVSLEAARAQPGNLAQGRSRGGGALERGRPGGGGGEQRKGRVTQRWTALECIASSRVVALPRKQQCKNHVFGIYSPLYSHCSVLPGALRTAPVLKACCFSVVIAKHHCGDVSIWR